MNEEIVRAALKGDMKMLDELLQAGIDPNALAAGDNSNLLHRVLVSVAVSPAPEVIAKLLQHGVDVNARDSYGNAPLHYAARLKQPVLMRLLLDAGADPDPVNNDGITPLRMTLMAKPFVATACETLLARGANANQSTPDGMSVREYAKSVVRDESGGIIALFDKHAQKS